MTGIAWQKNEYQLWISKHLENYVSTITPDELRELTMWLARELMASMTLPRLEEWRNNLAGRIEIRYAYLGNGHTPDR